MSASWSLGDVPGPAQEACLSSGHRHTLFPAALPRGRAGLPVACSLLAGHLKAGVWAAGDREPAAERPPRWAGAAPREVSSRLLSRLAAGSIPMCT